MSARFCVKIKLRISKYLRREPVCGRKRKKVARNNCGEEKRGRDEIRTCIARIEIF